MRDWTLNKYSELLSAIQEFGYKTQTVQEYMESPTSPVVILRHDIDRFPENALNMAKIEFGKNIRSTYYVRMTSSVFRPSIVKTLADLNHEVGYHYEVLSKANGNMQRSAILFKRELDALRQYAPVYTAAAHGSPLSKWNNQDIWNYHSPSTFNLTGEAYSSIDYEHIMYFTDTGRGWDSDKTNLRDRARTSIDNQTQVHTTDELISLIRSRNFPNICIQTHPERWNYNTFTWIRSAALDHATNLAKLVIQLNNSHKK